ncbi:MAG: leucine-rich repeat domain-containing protein [Oscillibacter sp.]|nr:leucine-rich repeat domain-containing protein [Oscillibacter sp.]
MVSILLDLAPDLKREGNVLRQMSEKGLLRELRTALESGAEYDRIRLTAKSRLWLTDYLMLSDEKADYFMTALQAVYKPESVPPTPKSPPQPHIITPKHTKNCTWTLDSNGVLTISGKNEIQNYALDSLPPWCKRSEGIYSVVIQRPITSIGDYAFFGCKDLKSAHMPDGVTFIGNYAFSGCENLVNVRIPDSVTSIGNDAFSGCKNLKNVRIPNKLTSIGTSAFNGCSNLMSIQIPETVTSIGTYAFWRCESLKSVTVPAKANIGWSAFDSFYTTVMQSKPLPTTQPQPTPAKKKQQSTQKPKAQPVTPPKPTPQPTTPKIATIDFGHTGDCIWTLYNNHALILRISGQGQMGTYNLVDNLPPWKNYRQKIEVVVIEHGVTSIGKTAFLGCTNLISILIPDSVTSIEYCAFAFCNKLSKATIPDSVTFIDNSAFFSCSGLKSVTISHNVTSIGDYAFRHCQNLKNVTIPANAKIGEDAFDSHTVVTQTKAQPKSMTPPQPVTPPKPTLKPQSGTPPKPMPKPQPISTPEPKAKIIKAGYTGSCRWILYSNHVFTISGQGQMERYSRDNNPPWWNYKKNIEVVVIKQGVTSIGNRAFACCSALTSVTIPDSVTSIEHRAFADCTSLTSVTIPNSVTSITSSAFSGCTGLASVTIPDSVTSIESYAFENCSKLKQVNVAGTTKIKLFAFDRHTQIIRR